MPSNVMKSMETFRVSSALSLFGLSLLFGSFLCVSHGIAKAMEKPCNRLASMLEITRAFVVNQPKTRAFGDFKPEGIHLLKVDIFE